MTTETLITDSTPSGDAASDASTVTTDVVSDQAATTDVSQEVAAQATEQQPANGEAKVEPEQVEIKGAPEQYEFSAPEGQQFDPDVISQFSEVAKELDLPQEAAQKVLDKMAPALQARQQAAMEQARTEWAESTKSDKEFGGDKLTESLVAGKRALDTFGSPELKTLLNETGLGNHPEVIRFFVRAGKTISEDTFVHGSNRQPGQGKSLASVLYDKSQG